MLPKAIEIPLFEIRPTGAKEWRELAVVARRVCGTCSGCDAADCVPCAIAFACPFLDVGLLLVSE